MAIPSYAHDRFFKEAFSRTDVVTDFIQAFLPAEFSRQLNADSLSRLAESYVGETLSEHFVDMLYAVTFGEEAFTIALLLEHKSYAEPYPHFQLAQYMLNYWQAQLKQQQPLRPVVPILIYHGTGRWRYQPMRQYFGTIPDMLATSIPDFHYYLINLTDRASSDQVASLRSGYAKLTAGLLATIRHKLRLVSMLESLKSVLDELADQPAGMRFVQTAFVYISHRSGLSKPEIVAIFHRITPINDQTVMSAVEEWIQEGEEKGTLKATLRHISGLLKVGMDEQTIATAFELPLSTVREYIALIRAQQ